MLQPDVSAPCTRETQHVERAGGRAGGEAGEVGIVHVAPACKLAPSHDTYAAHQRERREDLTRHAVCVQCVRSVCTVCVQCVHSTTTFAYTVPGSRAAGRGCESGSRPGSLRAAAK
eukprot:scaffold11245_cov90-Phaeocystis_antarctica.AAC.4